MRRLASCCERPERRSHLTLTCDVPGRSRMMMGQEGSCWEERIHKEEDALKDFMEEWDTDLSENIERMEAKKRAEAQSRADTAQSRLSNFSAQARPENEHGRLSRQLWSKMVPTYDSDAMPNAMSTAAAMNASVFDDEDALFDYFSTGKYARGSRKSLLFKVSNQQNNRRKTDFHDFVEANAKCTWTLFQPLMCGCAVRLSKREHRRFTCALCLFCRRRAGEAWYAESIAGASRHTHYLA